MQNFRDKLYNNNSIIKQVISQRDSVWTNSVPSQYRKANIVSLSKKDKTFSNVANKLTLWSKNNVKTIYVGGDEYSGKTFIGYAYLRRLFLKQKFNLEDLIVVPMSTVVSSCNAGFAGYKNLLDDYVYSGKTVFFIQGFYSHNTTTNMFFAELFDKAILNDWIIVTTGTPFNSVVDSCNVGKQLKTLFGDTNLSIYSGEYMRKLLVKNT